jgi:hypothetical protein
MLQNDFERRKLSEFQEAAVVSETIHPLIPEIEIDAEINFTHIP